MTQTRESVRVLEECIDLQNRKALDYQNPNSTVTQAMHYRRGVDSIYDTMHGKMLRIQSILESGHNPNFEGLEDSFKDLINYASFAVSYLRYAMEGQSLDRDIFNRPIKLKLDPGEKIPPKDEFLYVPADSIIPYDQSAEHINFTTTFNERYVDNQAKGNVFV